MRVKSKHAAILESCWRLEQTIRATWSQKRRCAKGKAWPLGICARCRSWATRGRALPCAACVVVGLYALWDSNRGLGAGRRKRAHNLSRGAWSRTVWSNRNGNGTNWRTYPHVNRLRAQRARRLSRLRLNGLLRKHRD